MFEAAVEDADPAVAEGVEGLVVGVAGSSSGVVQGAGAWAGLQGAEGPLVDRVIEALVAGVPGQDGALSVFSASSLVGAPGPRLRMLGTRAAHVLATVEGEPHAGRDLADADQRHHGWVYAGDERSAVPRVASTQADF